MIVPDTRVNVYQASSSSLVTAKVQTSSLNQIEKQHPSQEFRKISVSDAASAHIGNNYCITTSLIHPIPTNKDLDHYSKISTVDEEQQRCLDALFLTDPRLDRDRIFAAQGDRAKGTCEWIKTFHEYQNWFSATESSLLWIIGNPGKGKTYLSTYLAEELAMLENTIVLEFYCDNKNESRNTAVAVIRGLMFDLIKQIHTLSQYLSPALREGSHSLRDSSFEALWLIFIQMAEASQKCIICVLDGIDECGKNSIDCLVRRFDTFFAQPASLPYPLKLALTSRPLSKPNSLRLQRFPNLNLDSNLSHTMNHTQSDVSKFVEAEFGNYFNPMWRGRYLMTSTATEEWLSKMKADIVEKADGTFLWAGFAMKQLKSQRSPDSAENALRVFPKGLDAMYDRILLQIVDDLQDDADWLDLVASLLVLVVISVRPMSLGELSAAIPFQRTKVANWINLTRDLVDDCKGLLAVQDQTVDLVDQIVYLVHQSVKDHLLTHNVDRKSPINRLQVNERSAHEKLALACISCLQQASSDHASFLMFEEYPTQLNESIKRSFHLLLYSIFYWPIHARLCEKDIFDEKHQFFAKVSKSRYMWLEASFFLNHIPTCDEFSLLHVAARYDIPILLNRIIGTFKISLAKKIARTFKPGLRKKTAWDFDSSLPRYKANCTDSKDRTPLTWAAKSGNEVIVRLLLQKGAKPGHVDWFGLTPLSYAAERGNETIVQLLLKEGAIIESKDQGDRTALSYAAAEGHGAVVRLLLQKGAKVDTADYLGRTPLFYAAGQRKEEAVRLLIDAGAVVDSKDQTQRTPLSYAAVWGHEAIVRLLLQNGAAVEAKDDSGRTPMFYATENGQESAMMILIEASAKIVPLEEIHKSRKQSVWTYDDKEQRILRLPVVLPGPQPLTLG